jgi:hypothetical protein
MRPCERFMMTRGDLLANHGYTADPGKLERQGDQMIFYHYTRPEHVAAILKPGSGLYARRPVVWDRPPGIIGGYLVEGFLEPVPRWLTASPYFGDLGIEMVRKYVGNVLLRVEVPITFPGIYVAEYAHILECKHIHRRGSPALGLGYDCSNGHEVTQADVNSYVPAREYTGGHVAHVITVTRCGPGIAVPAEDITVCARHFGAGTSA